MKLIVFFLIAAAPLLNCCNKPGKVAPKPLQHEEIIEVNEIATANNDVFFTEEEILAPVAKTISSNNKYFLISASFSDYANAEKHQKALAVQGFSSEIITKKDGANGQFYKVSYMSFNNYNEAVQKLKLEKETAGKEDIWLLAK